MTPTSRFKANPLPPVLSFEKLSASAPPRPASSPNGGFLIGAVGGVAVGYSVAETNKGPLALRMGVGCGAIGAAIGALDGLQSRERTLIYRDP